MLIKLFLRNGYIRINEKSFLYYCGMERLLELLDNILGKGKPTNKGNYAYHCPFCNHQKRKLEIQITSTDDGENHWHCWTCNASGKKLVNLFKRLQQPREVIAELLSLLKLPNYYKDNNAVVKASILRLPDEFIPLWRNSGTIEQRNALNYLTNYRNTSLSEMIKYNIGYCERGKYSKMIIVPSYDSNGNLNYFVGRSYYKTDGFKHKNPDVSKDIVGFELFINWDYPIVLVEGSFDAIAVRRNAIPLFGKTISENLRKKIIENKVKEIYICLDKDAQKQAIEHAEEFMSNGINVYFVDLAQKDPAEIGFEKMIQIIKDTPPLTFSKLIEYKLDL